MIYVNSEGIVATTEFAGASQLDYELNDNRELIDADGNTVNDANGQPYRVSEENFLTDSQGNKMKYENDGFVNAVEQPVAEQPVAEQPAAEQPAAEQPAAEQPATEQPATEQPATEDEDEDEAMPPEDDGDGYSDSKPEAPNTNGQQGAGKEADQSTAKVDADKPRKKDDSPSTEESSPSPSGETLPPTGSQMTEEQNQEQQQKQKQQQQQQQKQWNEAVAKAQSEINNNSAFDNDQKAELNAALDLLVDPNVDFGQMSQDVKFDKVMQSLENGDANIGDLSAAVDLATSYNPVFNTENKPVFNMDPNVTLTPSIETNVNTNVNPETTVNITPEVAAQINTDLGQMEQNLKAQQQLGDLIQDGSFDNKQSVGDLLSDNTINWEQNPELKAQLEAQLEQNPSMTLGDAVQEMGEQYQTLSGEVKDLCGDIGIDVNANTDIKDLVGDIKDLIGDVSTQSSADAENNSHADSNNYAKLSNQISGFEDALNSYSHSDASNRLSNFIDASSHDVTTIDTKDYFSVNFDPSIVVNPIINNNPEISLQVNVPPGATQGEDSKFWLEAMKLMSEDHRANLETIKEIVKQGEDAGVNVDVSLVVEQNVEQNGSSPSESKSLEKEPEPKPAEEKPEDTTEKKKTEIHIDNNVIKDSHDMTQITDSYNKEITEVTNITNNNYYNYKYEQSIQPPAPGPQPQPQPQPGPSPDDSPKPPAPGPSLDDSPSSDDSSSPTSGESSQSSSESTESQSTSGESVDYGKTYSETLEFSQSRTFQFFQTLMNVAQYHCGIPVSGMIDALGIRKELEGWGFKIPGAKGSAEWNAYFNGEDEKRDAKIVTEGEEKQREQETEYGTIQFGKKTIDIEEYKAEAKNTLDLAATGELADVWKETHTQSLYFTDEQLSYMSKEDRTKLQEVEQDVKKEYFNEKYGDEFGKNFDEMFDKLKNGELEKESAEYKAMAAVFESSSGKSFSEVISNMTEEQKATWKAKYIEKQVEFKVDEFDSSYNSDGSKFGINTEKEQADYGKEESESKSFVENIDNLETKYAKIYEDYTAGETENMEDYKKSVHTSIESMVRESVEIKDGKLHSKYMDLDALCGTSAFDDLNEGISKSIGELRHSEEFKKFDAINEYNIAVGKFGSPEFNEEDFKKMCEDNKLPLEDGENYVDKYLKDENGKGKFFSDFASKNEEFKKVYDEKTTEEMNKVFESAEFTDYIDDATNMFIENSKDQDRPGMSGVSYYKTAAEYLEHRCSLNFQEVIENESSIGHIDNENVYKELMHAQMESLDGNNENIEAYKKTHSFSIVYTDKELEGKTEEQLKEIAEREAKLFKELDKEYGLNEEQFGTESKPFGFRILDEESKEAFSAAIERFTSKESSVEWSESKDAYYGFVESREGGSLEELKERYASLSAEEKAEITLTEIVKVTMESESVEQLKKDVTEVVKFAEGYGINLEDLYNTPGHEGLSKSVEDEIQKMADDMPADKIEKAEQNWRQVQEIFGFNMDNNDKPKTTEDAHDDKEELAEL